MTSRSVLVVGAGVAGPTLAYWLARHDVRVTVVERSRGPRSSGNPVDVRGPALPVVEAMGALPRLRELATGVRTMRLLGPSGRETARLPMSLQPGAVELPRADLAAALQELARDSAEFVFDDTVTDLHADDGGVDVAFERSAPRRFDLVVGADGLHSTVRRLAFGPEREFVRPTGLLVATVPLGGPAEDPTAAVLHNTPGRLVSLHPARGEAMAAFIFRRADGAAIDHRDTAAHRRIVIESHQGLGWRVPEFLDRVREAEDLYFDSVSRVDLPSWSRGRICLLGDAASCLSLLGEGSSLAIAGAHTLAEAVASRLGDPAQALRRYEQTHRARVTPKQRALRLSAALLVPSTRFGLATRNLAARLVPARG
ncbi:FAD-dependent oxidoreductase [Kitasatospora sp. NPDC101183]|uniref:FAD-dependent oxidoreductase n=1 Tax=Kitasatospora sp. NPDC101183 TaxID=3364100 RepID=UPI00380E7688